MEESAKRKAAWNHLQRQGEGIWGEEIAMVLGAMQVWSFSFLEVFAQGEADYLGKQVVSLAIPLCAD